MKDINKYNTGEILFRTTVCGKCEMKIKDVGASDIDLPKQNTKIPIGTTLIAGWTVYRNISLFMRKYCKIYDFNDTHIHVLENKNDILRDISSHTTIHKFNYDTILHLDTEEAHEFFYDILKEENELY